MTVRLYKAAEVCDLAQLQPFVLRSWEKEFPGIGLQKSEDSPRLYRQSDVDQLLRIKQMVFVEGLTLSGARRKIEESMPVTAAALAEQVSEVKAVLGADVHKRIAHVKNGLRSILHLLDGGNGEYRLTPPSTARGKAQGMPSRNAVAPARAKVAARSPAPAKSKTAKRATR